MKQLITLSLSALLLNCTPGFAQETKSSSADQTSLNLTIYNGGRALVREQRQIQLSHPTQNIAFMDVAEKIMPQTVAIQGLDVLEQNYDFDLLSPQALINKNLGNTVRIARRSSETGETLEWTEGSILSTNGGIILQMQDGSLESLNANKHYHMVFDQVPDNLRTTPTLSLRLKQSAEGVKDVEMTYLTTGLNWQSDYVLQLNDASDSASLDSWITLNNHSGISYQNANLQLLAGDLNLQQPGRKQRLPEEAVAYQARTMDAVSEQALHGYHLYNVPHKTTIKNKQSKQIKLFTAENIPLVKRLEDRAYVNSRGLNSQKSKPLQFLTVNNKKPALGLPLPKGIIRVYGKDNSGNHQFIGEDAIDHTAVNDEFEIKLGKAFDISLERKTTSVRKLSKKQTQLSREIRINNGSRKDQTVLISEIMPSQDWDIKQSSWPFQRKSPSEAEFEINIPAMSDLMITYQVNITYP